MVRKPSFVVTVASLYLLAYIIFFYRLELNVVFWMFLGSPVILGWMAYTILKFGKYDGEDLGENEEWGYSDRSRDSLGVF